MLFYLLSRGLSHDTAQSLLKWAFLEDTVAHIRDAALRATIEAVLALHLKDPTITAGRRE
jgi:Fe-S cluster assembly scaffold protein SufB